MTWFDDLHERVEREDQRPHVLKSGDGRLLVTERGARVLACELPGVNENLFFHTDKTGDGKVTGGDRLWIAPEVAYFWPSLEDARCDPKGTAYTPATIDPGDYRLHSRSPHGGLTVRTDMKLEDNLRRSELRLIVHRSFGSRDPLPGLPDVVRRLSFRIENVLEGSGSNNTMGFAGAWDIFQVSPTGTLICPTTGKVEPRSYYDPFGEHHVVCDDRSVRFLIDGQRRIKMGIRFEETTGCMGYYRRLGGGMSSLIVRTFNLNEIDPYCDLPRDHPAHDAAVRGELHPEMTRGDCLQAYNDDGDAFPGTSFGEMEYHDASLFFDSSAEARQLSSSNDCTTHVLAGPDEVIRHIAPELLGVGIEPLT